MVLLAHRGDQAPQAVFGDALTRMPLEFKQMYKDVEAEVGAGEPGEVMGRAVHLARQMVESNPLPVTGYDYKTGNRVELKATQPGYGVSLNVAGFICVDWSARGKGRKWAGASALIFLQWVIERLTVQEDFFCGECVHSFDWTILDEALGHIYQIFCLIVSPVAIGFPSMRKRRFMLGFKRSRYVLPEWFNPQRAFMHMFSRSVRTTAGSMYYRAPPAAVMMATEAMAQKRGLPRRQPHGEPWPFVTVQSPGQCARRASRQHTTKGV